MKNKAMIWKAILGVAVILFTLLLIWKTDLETMMNGKQEETKTDREATLKWYINYSWMNPENENAIVEYIRNEFGINIEFVIPKGNESEKLQTMIDMKTLPDFVTLGWWEPENQEMIDKGQVFALNELADQYDGSFFQNANENTLNWYTESDQNIYGYPNYSFTYEDYLDRKITASNQNFLVRKDIYEAIGSPDMTTPEGFAEAVRKAKEMYPEVNGKPLIPIGCDEFTNSGNNSFDLYLQNFLSVPFEKDHQYYDRNTDEEYIRWLKVFRQLGQEGYLEKEIFLDKRSQLEEKLVEGRIFCMLYQNSDMEQQEKTILKTAPERIYIPVEGPRNSKQDDPTLPLPGINGWTVTYISKNCEYPDRAIQLVSFLLSEEGQKFVSENGKDNFWMLLEYDLPEDENDIRQLKEWSEQYSVYAGQYELNFAENYEMTLVKKKLDAIWASVLPRLLLAKNDQEFDGILSEYEEKRNRYRYAEFEEAASALIEQNKHMMGIDS